MENVFKKVYDSYKENLSVVTNEIGKRDYKINPNYKEMANKDLNEWFEPIKKDYPDLNIEVKTGQGTARKDSPWIQMYIGKENSSGTRGFYCGISFDKPDAYMCAWLGIGVGNKQRYVKTQEKTEATKNYLSLSKSMIGEKLERGFEYEPLNPNGMILTKPFKEDFKMDELTKDLKYLIGIYKIILTNDKKRENNVSNEFINNEIIAGRNIIYKGYPGTGKSHTVEENHLKINDKFIEKNRYERITFYPEYSNAEFIGTIRPTIDNDGTPKYKPFAGPFTKILKKALEDKNHNYYLIIEEINRGDAESIFGDVFQLLDRDSNGASVYSISNPIISLCLTNGKNEDMEISIPRNLSIIATMNISDENVKTLDTAFERRWDTIWISGKEGKFDDCYIKGLGEITWGTFRETINYQVVHQEGIIKNEDKQLGPYFINKNFVSDEIYNINKDERMKFCYKVIIYLYTKVCKYDKTLIFDENIDSIDKLLELFEKDDFINVFNETIKEKLNKRGN